MKELTPEQENLVGDLQHHDKKVEKDIAREEKKHKMFPVNPERLDQILKKIGRRKL